MKYVWPYKLGSESARKLAERLQCKRISGNKRVRSFSKIINWGSSNTVEISAQRSLKIVNNPAAVAIAKNKLKTMNALAASGVVPAFTTDRSVAAGWLTSGACTVVYCRTVLDGHSGRGIVTATSVGALVSAPLYVQGISKAHEFRVHVGSGEVIDFAKKRRREGGDYNDLIKNLDNGWVFCRDGITLPSKVVAAAIKAVKTLGLDFGAVDVIYRERENTAWVLEVNTAPGLEGTTLERYTNYFRSME